MLLARREAEELSLHRSVPEFPGAGRDVVLRQSADLAVLQQENLGRSAGLLLRRLFSVQIQAERNGILARLNALLVQLRSTPDYLFSRAGSHCFRREYEGDAELSKSAENHGFSALSGTHGRIRTSGLPLRRRPLYPAELRGRMLFCPGWAKAIITQFPCGFQGFPALF